jgi:uncharacterized protein YlaN (UPF0358 family)
MNKIQLGDTNKKIERYIKVQINYLLEQCTENQKELFYKMYGDLDSIKFERDNNLRIVIFQLERTIIKNNLKNVKGV